MPMDLKRSTEKSAGATLLGVQVPWITFGVLLENVARREGDEATKCVQQSENRDSKSPVSPFSSSLNVNMEKSF